mmetsp:Transcript_6784/g.9984  ORF Transcript_6784/g.9984 Transcript_6784/m.9984 type:complete len:312 (-) Transcript_6784:29-964(-)
MDGWVQRLIARASRKELFRGESALHEACYSAAPLNTIVQILTLHPEAIMIADANGRTPLHWALSSKTQIQKARVLLQFLMSRECQALKLPIRKMLLARNDLGYTALDHACSSGAPHDIIQNVLQLCPEAASLTRCGRSPLHQLLEHVKSNELKMESESLCLLLDAYPESVRTKDRLGNLPLHLACYESIDITAFTILRNASKDFVAVKNSLGHTPLHVSAMNNAPSVIVDSLIEASPSTVTSIDVDGNVPLHLAFIFRASVLLKTRLILHGGEHLFGIVNDRGQTPIQGATHVEDVYDILRVMPHVACSCY